MSAAHTPGPWRVSAASMDGFSPIMAPGGEIVALVSLLNPKAARTSQMIAAAPDLLEALSKAVKWLAISDDPRCDKDFHAAEAAIAKALARTPNKTGDEGE